MHSYTTNVIFNQIPYAKGNAYSSLTVYSNILMQKGTLTVYSNIKV